MSRVAIATVNGIDLEYESFGSESAPLVVLIIGVGAQMTMWPESFCERLADAGLRVVRAAHGGHDPHERRRRAARAPQPVDRRHTEDRPRVVTATPDRGAGPLRGGVRPVV